MTKGDDMFLRGENNNWLKYFKHPKFGVPSKSVNWVWKPVITVLSITIMSTCPFLQHLLGSCYLPIHKWHCLG